VTGWRIMPSVPQYVLSRAARASPPSPVVTPADAAGMLEAVPVAGLAHRAELTIAKAGADVERQENNDIHRCWKWWCKKRPQPPDATGVRPRDGVLQARRPVALNEPPTSKQRFALALRGTRAKTIAESVQRMDELRGRLSSFTRQELDDIAGDVELLERVWNFLGVWKFGAFVAAIGMCATGKTAEGADVARHLSGRQIDEFIDHALEGIDHLRQYSDRARSIDGSIATVDRRTWQALYQAQFPSNVVGSQTERGTDSFMADRYGDQVTIMKSDRGVRSDGIYEGIRRYAHGAVLDILGPHFNEGVTEYFTRLLTDRDGNPPAHEGAAHRDSHRRNWQFIRDLLPILGGDTVEQERVLAQIYFEGRTELLRQRCLPGGVGAFGGYFWNNLEPAIKAGRWRAARSQLAWLQAEADDPDQADDLAEVDGADEGFANLPR
jgi:hypothetical protein